MPQIFDPYFWKEFDNIRLVWLFSFIAYPLIIWHVFFFSSRLDKSRFEKSIKHCFLYTFFFVPAFLATINVSVKIAIGFSSGYY